AATGSDAITTTLSPAGFWIAEFSGITTSNPVDVTNAQIGNGVPTSGSTNATTNANDLIFGACDAGATAGVGAGFTALDNEGGNLDEYKTVTTTGSYAATFTTSQQYAADMVAFKAAALSCTSPTGNEGDMMYNKDYHVM